jgi:SAM-dependent methyltransferase
MRRTLSGLMSTLGLTRPVFALRFFLRRLKPTVMLRNLRYSLAGAPDGLPLPSTSARMLVAGSADPDWFLSGGVLGANAIRSALERHGRHMQDFERILDFGCGCGRVLRHWGSLKTVKVFGTDMQHRLLRECRRVLPFAHVAVNGPHPPLPFADASFDLVYSLSVFTHLDERQQLLWRDEIRRILKPEGLWIVTTQGDAYLPKLSREERMRFESGDVVCQRSEYRGLNLCQAFHPERYIRDVFADGFSIMHYEPEGARGNPRQDLYLLRREPAHARLSSTVRHRATAAERSGELQRTVRPFPSAVEV